MKAEIRRRLSLIYPLKGDFTDGSRDAYEGLLSWLDTRKETPTWVIRAEQRKKDQAAGKKFAIMEIRAEIERRMFEDYNGPDAEQNETAQGVCAGLLAFLDTLEAEEKPTGWGEEDKIKAKMLKHFKSKTKKTWCNIPVSDIIAWLEKETPTIEETELNSIAFLEQLGYSCVPPSSQSVNRKSKEKEVDLEEHYKQWLKEYIEQSEGYYPTAQAIALHFYELGQCKK